MREAKVTTLDWIIFGPATIVLWTLLLIFIVIPICLYERFRA